MALETFKSINQNKKVSKMKNVRKIKPISPTPPLYVKDAEKFVRNIKRELSSEKTKKELLNFSKLLKNI